MTQREQQIFKLIKENPLISQKDLADKVGITRTSVAVHISNLMKKGYIEGKGYILNEKNYVAVIGGVNIDIRGASFEPLIMKDSNPGKVHLALGGVGRNIAHNLRLLDTEVKLVTAFGTDANSDAIQSNCVDMGMDISHSLVVPGGQTSTYLFITNEKGEMELAVSDMEIYENITPEYIETQMEMLNKAKICILDTNIPQETIDYIAKTCKADIMADPVSCAKLHKLENILDKIKIFKPNRMEAEMMTGVKITDLESMKAAGEVLRDKGIENVFISLGNEGCFCSNGQEQYLLPCCKGEIKNTTGAGDSFTAALCWGFLNELSLKDTAKAALSAASINVEGKDTINPELSSKKVRERMSKVSAVS